MSFRFLEPHTALKKYIHHYACCEIGSHGKWSPSDMASPGLTALAIALQRDQISLRINGDTVNNFNAITYTGQITQAIHFDFYNRLKLFFVIFRPCGAFPLLGIRQEECKNICLNFSDLMGSSVRCFEQQLVCQHQTEEVKKIVDQFFLQRILGNSRKQKKKKQESLRLTQAVKQMSLFSHRGSSIKEICLKVGYSLSTLERHMKKIVGVTPKEFQRIMRFNGALQFIKQNPSSLTWPQVAQWYGYYDQTHFIKEFKHFYGKTPAEYSAKDDRILSDMAVQGKDY